MACNTAEPPATLQISNAGTTLVRVIPVCGVTAISGAVTLNVVATTQTSLVSPATSTVSQVSILTVAQSSVPTSSSSSVSTSSSSVPTSSSSVPSSSSPVPSSSSSALELSSAVSSTSSSVPASSSSQSLPLGAIIGTPLAALALLLLVIIFLLCRLRRRRQRLRRDESAGLAPVMPFESSIREWPGNHVSVNDESRLATSSALTSPVSPHSQNTFPASRRQHGGYTPGSLTTPHSSSDLNSHFQSNMSDDLTGSVAGAPALSYVSNPTVQISPISDRASVSAPPAYDSLPNRISHFNSSWTKS